MKKKYGKTADVRVGVIGYGGAFNMGRGHLQEMRAAGMTPVAVAEVDAARLITAQADFPGIETYPSVGAMLKKSDVDLVTIITPHNTHAKLALECLQAGKHVVCEKPLAITTAECDAMIAAAKKSGVVLSTYHNRHWDGWILRALDLVKKKKAIGRIYKIEARWGRRELPGDWWRSSRSISGGILYDWGVHLLEYGLQLADSEIVEVSGYARQGFWGPKTKWKKDANEDEAAAVIRFANGIWMNLNITSLDSNVKPGFLEITGTEGSYVLSTSGYTIYRREGARVAIEEGPHRPNEWHRFYENIAAHLVKGTKLAITPEWSRRPIHILDLAVQSAKLDRALPAKYH
jgi:scyllo-inositol 2-dehydrogenase (NADP+)